MKDNVILCWCPNCNKFLTPAQVEEEERCEACKEEVYFYEDGEDREVLDFINMAYTSKNLTRICEILESYNSWID